MIGLLRQRLAIVHEQLFEIRSSSIRLKYVPHQYIVFTASALKIACLDCTEIVISVFSFPDVTPLVLVIHLSSESLSQRYSQKLLDGSMLCKIAQNYK